MKRDEIYRRSMVAALAVTGRRIARVSLGLCIAGASTGCIEDGGMEDFARSDSMVANQAPDANSVSGPDMRPFEGDVSLAEVDISVFPEEDADLPDAAIQPVDQGEGVQSDAGELDPEMIADGGEPATCLPEEGTLTDWRCCEGHGFDRNIPGCTPCNRREERSQWVDCVTCDAQGDQGSQGGQEAMEEYMACCDATNFNFEMGCIAWGPPAPPEFDGRSLGELLGDLWEVA